MANACSYASSPGAGPSSLPPPAALSEELVEEILLRFPPDEPAGLFRVALVCKPWCRLISGPGFRRRFRELHRTPPMLGFLCRTGHEAHEGSCFVPTTAFCPPGTGRFDWKALDAHHGRVLGRRCVPEEEEDVLIVWDPITDEQREMPVPPRRSITWAATVLCAAAAGGGAGVCHHLGCHRGPFLVVFLGFDAWVHPYETFICTYSSDADAWSEQISIQHLDDSLLPLFSEEEGCTVLVGNALYFGVSSENITLKYNLESRELSWIRLPEECSSWRRHVLTTTEEGVLGVVTVSGSKLSMWLRKDAPQVDAGWTKIRVNDLKTLLPLDAVSRVIDLKTLLPLDCIFISPRLVGFADGPGILFMMVESALYTIDLKSCKVELYPHKGAFCIVPYMSFYTPELKVAHTGEEPSASGSNT